jgi:penicillin-binding protein activator
MRTAGILAAAAALALATGGCATRQHVAPRHRTEVRRFTEDWSSTDLQSVTEGMVGDLVRSPAIVNGNRPVVQVSTVRNRTAEHIDTREVTDRIRSALSKTGMVRFATVPPAAPKPEWQVGADYLLYGEINSVVKPPESQSEVSYRFALNLVDVETGIIEWTDEKDIRRHPRHARRGDPY